MSTAAKSQKSAPQQETASAPKATEQRNAGRQRVESLVGNFAVQRMVETSLGSGAPLDDGTRARMQQHFGRDFSAVRVHRGEDAAKSARGVHARAFTTGSNIVFNEDEYRPGSAEGQKLIAHELAHVVQQSSGPARPVALKPDAPVSEPDDPLEVEADRASDGFARGGTPIPLTSSESARHTIHREEGKKRDEKKKDPLTSPPLLAFFVGFDPSIADQYPPLVALLPDDDIAGLEAASELRYSLRPGGKTSKAKERTEEQKAAGAAAKTSVQVPLITLLTPEAQFVDVDQWEVFYGTVKAFGGSASLGAFESGLTGELARNEIMRRYFKRHELTLHDPVTIELVDPEGKTAGPSRLRFLVKGTAVTDSQGLISPPDLAEAFGALETDIDEVSEDANTVALAAHLMLELEEVEPLATKLAADAPANPKEHALNKVRGVAKRIEFDQKYVQQLSKKKAPPMPAETEGIAGRYDAIQKSMAAAVTSAEAWHAANPAGESLGMFNERIGTATAGYAMKKWDEGGSGYVVGGAAYAGTFVIAFVDAFEQVFSFGFHDAATAVATAYAAGDISWNEGEKILNSAMWRALLVAAVTRGLGAVGSRLGAAAAGGLGIAARTTTFGVVSGGIGGGFTGAGSVASQALLTKGMAGRFENPVAQSIWNQGMPTGKDLAFGIVGGTAFGSLGGVRGVQAANAKAIGTTVSTPSGPMKVIAITKQGYELLEPIGGRVKAPSTMRGGGQTVIVQPGWKPSDIVPEAPPSSAMVVSGRQTGLAVPGMSTEQALVSNYLKAMQTGWAGTPSMLVAGYESMMRPAASLAFESPLSLMAGEQPYGLLGPGPQPYGLLGPGPQPYGLLGPGLPPSELMLAPEGRYIPGEQGIVIGGDSQKLGKNTMVSYGLPRSTSFSGWQPHHIIPSEVADHAVIQKIGMNLDHPSNSIMLPEPATNFPGTLPTHAGYHSAYNQAVKAELNALDINLPVRVLELRVFQIQNRLRAALQSGTPLYFSKGATPTTWPNVLNPPVIK